MFAAEIQLGRADVGQVWIVARPSNRSARREMQQVPDRHLDFARVILTKAGQNDPSFLVQKVKPRPGVVAPVVPGPIIVVLGYRKGNALLTNISLHLRTFV